MATQRSEIALRLGPGQSLSRTTLENFFPGYFALFMATGIVLWAILISCIIRFPKIVWDDLHHRSRESPFSPRSPEATCPVVRWSREEQLSLTFNK